MEGLGVEGLKSHLDLGFRVRGLGLLGFRVKFRV